MYPACGINAATLEYITRFLSGLETGMQDSRCRIFPGFFTTMFNNNKFKDEIRFCMRTVHKSHLKELRVKRMVSFLLSADASDLALVDPTHKPMVLWLKKATHSIHIMIAMYI